MAVLRAGARFGMVLHRKDRQALDLQPFVRFVEDDGRVNYYATYTAYNGRVILPQLIETLDFLHFRVP